MPPVLGILLAGGQSRRMGGGDKFFQKLGGHTILEHVIQNAQLQVDQLIINANGDPARFDSYQLTVVPDSLEGHQGPLAGVLTGLEWASAHMPDAEWIVTFAADAPFFPKQLVNDLKNAVRDNAADIACASSGGRTHPVFAIWPVRLKDDLDHALRIEEIRKIDRWTGRYAVAHIDYPLEPMDPFFNVNRPEDLAEAVAYVRANLMKANHS
ncbi:MAG: molybdenum cofactor guanylyltransferase MobA [Rhodospirillaceae bacterium]|jgi:molybdopterin-guanine dinucleotide biosynthesis protein A